MQRSRKIAFADWDGSLRSGYHVQDFLADWARSDGTVQEGFERIKALSRAYEDGTLAYQPFVSEVNQTYAALLEGRSERSIDERAELFSQTDGNLMPTYRLLDLLASLNVDVVVVTGSPAHIVAPYLVHGERLYGTCFGADGGIFDGSIKTYYGGAAGKERIAAKILGALDRSRADLSIGDSESDEPLFRTSDSYMVVRNGKLHLSTSRSTTTIDMDEFPTRGFAVIKKLFALRP